jgi:hypothetical protein
VDGDLQLTGVVCEEQVSLIHASIDGYVLALGAQLACESGYALDADAARIGGSAVMRHGPDGEPFRASGGGGVSLAGATIGKTLDLSGAQLEARGDFALLADSLEVGGAVFLRGCTIGGPTTLYGASVGQSLDLSGARLESELAYALDLRVAQVRGGVAAGRWEAGATEPVPFRAAGGVVLAGATIGAALDLTGAELEREETPALFAESVTVTGPAFLRDGFHAKGEVNVLGASFGQSLDLTGATLENPGANALQADSVTVAGPMFLRDGFQARGALYLVGARLGQSLDLRGAVVDESTGPAVVASSAEVKGSVYMNAGIDADGALVPFRARGGVVLAGAKLGSIDASGAVFENPDGWALDLATAEVTGNAAFVPAVAPGGETLPVSVLGGVALIAATVGRVLNFSGAKIVNEHGYAVFADALEVRGAAFFRAGFEAIGGLNLLGASVGQSLDLSSARLVGPGRDALTAEAMAVKGSVHMGPGGVGDETEAFRAVGTVNLTGARVGDSLALVDALLEQDPLVLTALGGAARALVLDGADIGGDLILGLSTPPQGDVSLVRARAARLHDLETAWPAAPHRMHLDGFVYDGFREGAPLEVEKRMDWLWRQDPDRVKRRPWSGGAGVSGVVTQPFEQLAAVYERSGDDKSAREVRIRKQRAIRDYGNVRSRERLWSRFLDWAMLYGYAAYRSLILGVILLVLGTVIFWAAHDAGALRATTDPAAPFQPFVYSLDTLAPIIDLGQEATWAPDGAKRWGDWVQRYLWLHIALGWIVTTLAVAALTGLVRRD